MHRGREIVEDRAPGAFVVRTAPVALIDDDEVEEVGRVLAEVRRAARTAHEGLEDGEKDAAVLRHPALLANVGRVDAHQGIVGKGREGVVSLVSQDVSVGQEQDARPARGLGAAVPIRQVPAALEQLPGELEGDKGLAGAGGQRQQDARVCGFLAGLDGLQHARDSDVLVVAPLPGAALVLERHGGEAIAPGVHGGVGQLPQLIGARIAGHVAFGAGRHVDAVDRLAVGGVRIAHRQFCGIALGLADAFGVGLVPGLGFDDGQLGIAVDEDVVGDLGLGPRALAAAALQATERDAVFTQNATAFHHAPAGNLQGGVDVLGAGFSFVHRGFEAGMVSVLPFLDLGW